MQVIYFPGGKIQSKGENDTFWSSFPHFCDVMMHFWAHIYNCMLQYPVLFICEFKRAPFLKETGSAGSRQKSGKL